MRCQGLIMPEADFRRFPARLSAKPGQGCRHLRKGGSWVRHSVEIAGMVDISGPIGVRIDSYSFRNTAARLEVPVQNIDHPTCASASQRAECPDTRATLSVRRLNERSSDLRGPVNDGNRPLAC